MVNHGMDTGQAKSGKHGQELLTIHSPLVMVNYGALGMVFRNGYSWLVVAGPMASNDGWLMMVSWLVDDG